MKRFLPDRFTQMLLGTVLLASLFPATGSFESFMHIASNVAISLLFFLHGARLSREAAMSGLKQPRLHILTLCCTFVLFPLLGLGFKALFPNLLTPQLWLGVLFVCTLSSTVQSSIAFTSIARGNVPAAICGATASNLLGIVVTPLLVTLLLHRHHEAGGISEVLNILLQLLLPFVLGNVLRRWIGEWVGRHRGLLAVVDRGGILLAVYAAFSAAVAQGVWHLFPPAQLALLVFVNACLLGTVMLITTFGARAMGMPRADEIVLVFCGSKKSLASGIPIASVLFSGSGVVLLPIMIFHQMQLMLCAVMARRYAEKLERQEAAAGSTSAAGDNAAAIAR
ncbi:bile acid:sodium symporter [Herbaspirillum lusitanum]|uniref:Bile acid:sodium symporter n=1 Tax=Herbaspirillum lusitanum TaxID=213312 RepID=A0ABW9A6L6_9BURK